MKSDTASMLLLEPRFLYWQRFTCSSFLSTCSNSWNVSFNGFEHHCWKIPSANNLWASSSLSRSNARSWTTYCLL